MAFPTTSVLDNFDRADGDPGSSWTSPVVADTTKFIISSNTANFVAGNDGGYWNPGTFGADSEVFWTVTTKSGNSELYIRIASPGASANGYSFRFLSGFGVFRFFRIDGGVFTKLGVDEGPTINSGDKYGGDIQGSTLTGYSTTGGVWSAISTRSDATYSAAGYIGLWGNTSGLFTDDFGGGTIAGTPPPTTVPITVAANARW